MKVKAQSKEFVRPLRSGSKVQQNMKLPGPPPEKMSKISSQVEDLSILKKSVDTSVTNPLEILKVFQGGTPEIIETMKNECSMIYECKVCRNLFRSIANFITHKRNYCTSKYSQQSHSNRDAREHSLLVGSVRGNVTTTRKTTRRDILSLLDNLQERFPDSHKGNIFSEIPHSMAAVYNTTHSTPIYKEGSCDSSVVVGPSGHIIGNTQDGGNTTDCKSCGESVRQIESHLSTCNSVFKPCYRCPLCDKFFTTAWAVYRHLKKVHGKSTEQVKKLRSLITKQELPVEMKFKKQTIIMPTSTLSNTADKGWLEELEKNGVDGLYKCYICGKQFERRVALTSHTQACEKRKPGAIIDPKKQPVSPREHSSKPASPAVQMNTTFKKEDFSDTFSDCRVVATRLTEGASLAALSPSHKNDEHGNDHKINSMPVPSASSVEQSCTNVAESLQNHINERINEGEMDENMTEQKEVHDVCNNEKQNLLKADISIDQIKSDRCNNKMLINLFEDDVGQDESGFGGNQSRVNSLDDEDYEHYEDNELEHNAFENNTNNDRQYVNSNFGKEASKDIFASQSSFDFVASNSNGMAPLSVSGSEKDVPANKILTNGFLLSPPQSSKPALCPEKPCNGWKDPEKNLDKNNFFSAFVESSESNDNDITMNNDSVDTSLSNEETDKDDCEIDSLAITRIICGSVKPVRLDSEEEERVEDRDEEDTTSETSDKPTPSISTELSFDFEVIGQEYDVSSDNEMEDVNLSLDPYISKTDSTCLLCYDKIADTRYGLSHVAKHLGVNRYACSVPLCTVQSYSKLNIVEHLRSEHLLECSSLVRNVKAEDMFLDDVPDFLGFEADEDAMTSTYREFFGVLFNRHGIILSEED